MEFKFNKEYFLSNDDDSYQYGRHTIHISFDSQFNRKVLSILYNAGKPYITLVGDDVEPVKEVVKKVKSNIKSKKKVKIDEPKESTTKNQDTNSNEKES